jgi:hypothetical protein
VPELPKTVGVAADLAGCPNRCRHCYLGAGPNPGLDSDVLRELAEAFWSWRRPGDDAPWFDQVHAASWYREPDYRDDYRELYRLEKELSRAEPRRYELLSVWRLARDPGYAVWAKEVGPRTCQFSFFGLERVNDWFHRRRGAFRDALTATERLLREGMIPRWQIFLTRAGMEDLRGLMDLAREMRLRGRVAELGAEFDVFCHPPGPDGEAWRIEHLRVTEEDLAAVPAELMESTRRHFGGSLDWRPERQITEEVLAGAEIPLGPPEETWFFMNGDLDLFTNWGGEVSRAWRLGNFRKDALDACLVAFERDAPPGLHAWLHVADAHLAGRFGRRDGRRIYTPADLKSRWVHLWTAAEEGSERD